MTTGPRCSLSWDDLAGLRVGLYGLGVEGHASLARCRTLGIEPVVVADDAPDPAARSGEPRVLPTDAGGLDELLRCDVVIKSPGISRYSEPVRALVAAGVAVTSGVNLWLTGADLSRVLLVTGSKGKSTTTAVAAHLLEGFGYRVLLAGNIGQPPFDPAVGSDFDYWAVEVSSYQAADLAVSPPVTAVTSLSPDHLPWHDGDVETYYRDKLSATSQPGARVTVANGDDDVLRRHASLLGPAVRWVRVDHAPDWVQELGLLGRHNHRNARIAAEALRAMGVPEASDPAALQRAAAGFAGLPSRLQIVGQRGEVTFVDDNLSTNVLPALAAVDAFPDRRVALLVGGQSRGIDYRQLGLGLQSRTAPCLIVTMPTNGPDIREQVLQAGAGPHVRVVDAVSLAEAVRLAADWAAPDGVVLLSPAAPSFDLFRNYRDRGAQFVTAMRAAGGRPSGG